MSHMAIEEIRVIRDTDWHRNIGHHVLETGFGVKNTTDDSNTFEDTDEIRVEPEFTD
jgi:hypothetical protein